MAKSRAHKRSRAHAAKVQRAYWQDAVPAELVREEAPLVGLLTSSLGFLLNVLIFCVTTPILCVSFVGSVIWEGVSWLMRRLLAERVPKKVRRFACVLREMSIAFGVDRHEHFVYKGIEYCVITNFRRKRYEIRLVAKEEVEQQPNDEDQQTDHEQSESKAETVPVPEPEPPCIDYNLLQLRLKEGSELHVSEDIVRDEFMNHYRNFLKKDVKHKCIRQMREIDMKVVVRTSTFEPDTMGDFLSRTGSLLHHQGYSSAKVHETLKQFLSKIERRKVQIRMKLSRNALHLERLSASRSRHALVRLSKGELAEFLIVSRFPLRASDCCKIVFFFFCTELIARSYLGF